MLLRVRGGSSIVIGCVFYHYFPKFNYAYDKGYVHSVECDRVDVDFGDTMVRFYISDIAYVVNPELGEEHYMSVEDGVLLADYRSAPKPIENAANDPVLDSFQELLTRI